MVLQNKLLFYSNLPEKPTQLTLHDQIKGADPQKLKHY